MSESCTGWTCLGPQSTTQALKRRKLCWTGYVRNTQFDLEQVYMGPMIHYKVDQDVG